MPPEVTQGSWITRYALTRQGMIFVLMSSANICLKN